MLRNVSIWCGVVKPSKKYIFPGTGFSRFEGYCSRIQQPTPTGEGSGVCRSHSLPHFFYLWNCWFKRYNKGILALYSALCLRKSTTWCCYIHVATSDVQTRMRVTLGCVAKQHICLVSVSVNDYQMWSGVATSWSSMNHGCRSCASQPSLRRDRRHGLQQVSQVAFVCCELLLPEMCSEWRMTLFKFIYVKGRSLHYLSYRLDSIISFLFNVRITCGIDKIHWLIMTYLKIFIVSENIFFYSLMTIFKLYYYRWDPAIIFYIISRFKLLILSLRKVICFLSN